MKKIFLILIALFCTQPVFSQWEEITYYPTINNVYNIASPDDSVIFMASHCDLFYTADLGETWNSFQIDTSTTISVFDFTNPTSGIMIMSNGAVFISQDGGMSWSPNGSQVPEYPSELKMTDSLTGYCIYKYDSIHYKTSDGGLSWQALNTSIHNIYDFHFVNKDTGWFAAGHLLRTYDGGQSVDTIIFNELSSQGVRTVFFLDTLNGWMSIPNDSIYRTWNGGNTWFAISSDFPLDIHFTDSIHGFGFSGSIWSYGYIYITVNGGINWSRKKHPANIFELKKFGNNYWLCCEGGKIARSSDLTTWTPLGTNLDMWDYSDIMILNDSTHCLLENSYNIYITENDGKNYHEYIPTIIDGFWYGKSVWMESREKIWLGIKEGKILKTLNGGLNWTISYDFMNNQNTITDIQFVDSLHGWAMVNGGTISFEQNILRTVDGGQTWVLHYLQEDNRLIKMFFTDMLHGWVCDTKGQVNYTCDGGISWNTVVISQGEHLHDIHFIDNQTGYVFGKRLYKTTDGGITWVTIANSLTDVFMTGYFVNENKGWVLKPEGLWYTTDGGVNWVLQFSAGFTNFSYRFMEFYDENYGILITNVYVRGPITIFKTYNGGINWIEEKPGQQNGIIFVNSPNPFCDNTQLHFSLDRQVEIEIRVFNIHGKLMEVPVSKNRYPPGTYSVSIETANWDPGVYICQLSSGNKSKTLKMLKVE